jgi:Cys-rich repeat protein
MCVDGFCEEITPPAGDCATNADCGAGRVCRDTRCYAECATDAMCGAGNYCLEGRCRFDDRPRPSCGASATCAMGSVCRNGSCRIPCATADECLRFDVQYNFCLEGFCATTNEATSNCMSATDCSAGSQCVDGICR